MSNKTNAKIITMHSPIPKTGQTTLANLLGISLAEEGKFTLLIELSKYTGFSVFLNKGIDLNSYSLQECLANPEKTANNIIKSRHNSKFYYLCQNYESSVNDKLNVNPENLDKMLKKAEGTFDYIILDLASDIIDPFTVYVLSNNLTNPVYTHIEVINENLQGLQRLNDMANIIKKAKIDLDDVPTTMVINQSLKRFSPLIAPHISNLPHFVINNIIDIPYINEYQYLCNEGNIFDIGEGESSKAFFNDIKLLSKVVTSREIKGVGNILKREKNLSAVSGDSFSLFKGKKEKTKKEKKEKTSKNKKKKDEVGSDQ